MTLDELHENRGDFVAGVQQNVAASLSRNGLPLKSVSQTSLDQTPFKSLDENNAFNAVGMRRLAEVAKQRRNIAISQTSQKESKAQAAADEARVEAVVAAEAIATARAGATAQREKQVALLQARKQSEIKISKMKGRKNPYSKMLKQPRTMRLDTGLRGVM